LLKKRKVILVTDGDIIAQKAVETATRNIGGRCISRSAGNPTLLTGIEIIEQIKKAAYDPVVVMVDDCGDVGTGKGEAAMVEIIKNPDIEVLGIVAVASNGKEGSNVKVDCSFTKDGKKIYNAVDKYGNNMFTSKISGDTLSVLRDMNGFMIVGIGDPGKMDGKDHINLGAPITTAALREILKASGQQTE
jgi:stage V sporulation protein AE